MVRMQKEYFFQRLDGTGGSHHSAVHRGPTLEAVGESIKAAEPEILIEAANTGLALVHERIVPLPNETVCNN